MSVVQVTRLGEIADFIRGINFKPDDVVPMGTEGTVVCMRTKNVQENLDCEDIWSVSESFVKRKDQLLHEGDILVSSANSWNLVGKCCWVPKLPWPASFGGFISVLRANPEKVLPRYLYRWFASNRTQALLRSFGQKTTNISNLNFERALNLKVPVPPLPEQRRIAAILDQADALRAKRREALAQLDSLTQSIFIEMFGDPMSDQTSINRVSLSDVTSRITDGTHLTPKFVNSGVPFIFVKNFKDGRIDFDTDKYITEAEHSELYKRCPVEPGDILYTTVGATYGQAVMVGAFTKFAFQRHVAHLKPDRKKILPDFLGSVMKLPFIKRQADRWARGAAQPTVNLTELRQFQIPLPNLDMQIKFSSRTKAVEELKVAHGTSLNYFDTLFDSLQHRAFRGEL